MSILHDLLNLKKPPVIEAEDGDNDDDDHDSHHDPVGLSELVDQYFDKYGHSLEGRSGLIRFTRLVRLMGYKDPQYYGQMDHDAAIGDLIEFLEDNSGALTAMVEWIQGQHNSEWESALAEVFEDGEGHQPTHESVQEDARLDEKVFDEERYDWFVWHSKKPSKPFDRRGGMIQLEQGMRFGLRAATSKPGTWRMIVKQRGPSIIFSIPAGDAQELMDKSIRLR